MSSRIPIVRISNSEQLEEIPSGDAIDIASGGTGQTTAQAAIDALTAVSEASNNQVLTKDASTGHAIFKTPTGGSTDFLIAQVFS
jgi:hypothetical protein